MMSNDLNGHSVYVVKNRSQLRGSGTLVPFYKQMFASCGSIVLNMSSGMTNGFSAVLLPQAKSANIYISQDMSSWIAGIVTLAMPFGGILGGLLMDYFGRKRAQIFSCLICLLGWLDIALSADDMIVLCVGRFFTGLCIGIISSVGAVYIAEISEPHYRGFILAFITFAISIGILLVHVLGSFLYWKSIAVISMCVPLLSLVIVCLSPETPTWLIRNGFADKAKRSFYRLRVDKLAARSELEILLKKHACDISYKRLSSAADSVDGCRVRKVSRFYVAAEAVGSRLFWKPFLIIAVFFVTQQFSGTNAIVFYTVDIVKKASPDFSEYANTVFIDICRVLVSAFACWLLKRCNRRTVFLVSAIGSIFSLFALAASLKFFQNVFSGWLPVIFIMAYVIFSTVGLVPLPWVMTGEIFPVVVRDFGNGVSNCFAFLMMFTVVKTAPSFFVMFGLSGTFCLYGCITTVGTVILYFCLPETNNRSLQEVEETVVETGTVMEKS